MKKPNTIPYFSLRLTRGQLESIRRHNLQTAERETMVFLLCGKVLDHRLVLREIFLPEENDLESATASFVQAAKDFKVQAWKESFKENLVLIDLHTHVHGLAPRFSFVDIKGFRENVNTVAKYFPEPVDFGSLVANPEVRNFSGSVWSAKTHETHPVTRLEVIGVPPEFIIAEDEHSQAVSGKLSTRYARQQIIPGFKQSRFANVRVGVVGASGNGSPVITALAGMGVGELVIMEGDVVEETNLNRLTYATLQDIGRNKAEVAAEYVRAHNPEIKVTAIPEFLTPDNCPLALRECQIVFGCGDRAGVRKLLLEDSLRFLWIYIDLGCEIRALSGDGYEAGGQVRLFLPGEMGCPVCYGQLDLAQAALDLLPESEKTARRSMGYSDDGEVPTPSVVHLNMLTASLAMNLFTKIMMGEDVSKSAFVSFDAHSLKTVTAPMPPVDGCPMCGPSGLFARGDMEDQEDETRDEPLSETLLEQMAEPTFDRRRRILTLAESAEQYLRQLLADKMWPAMSRCRTMGRKIVVGLQALSPWRRAARLKEGKDE